MPFRRCAYLTCSALVREGAGAWCPPHAAAQAATARRYEQQRAHDPFRQFYQTRAGSYYAKQFSPGAPGVSTAADPRLTWITSSHSARRRPGRSIR
jgi:hypothetical protein